MSSHHKPHPAQHIPRRAQTATFPSANHHRHRRVSNAGGANAVPMERQPFPTRRPLQYTPNPTPKVQPEEDTKVRRKREPASQLPPPSYKPASQPNPSTQAADQTSDSCPTPCSDRPTTTDRRRRQVGRYQVPPPSLHRYKHSYPTLPSLFQNDHTREQSGKSLFPFREDLALTSSERDPRPRSSMPKPHVTPRRNWGEVHEEKGKWVPGREVSKPLFDDGGIRRFSR